MGNALTDSYTEDEGGSDAAEDTEAPAAAEETAAAEPQAEQETKKRPLTPAGGRRARAREAETALAGELKGLRDTIAEQQRSYAERLEAIQRENAELRGQFSGYMSQQQQRQAETQRREPEGPDPDKLIEEANAALDRKDFNTYQTKFLAAAEARALRAVAPRIQQQAAPQQSAPQAHPMLQMVAGQYMDVVTDGDAFEIARAHDRILARTMQEGPDRWKRAFEEGRKYLKGKTPAGRPQFSQATRGVLGSQVSGERVASRGANEGTAGNTGVRLTQREIATAAKYRMSKEEYAEHLAAMHPERVETE